MYVVIGRYYTGEIYYESDPFDSYEEAKCEMNSYMDGMVTGADLLEEMGEDFDDPDDINWSIEEV